MSELSRRLMVTGGNVTGYHRPAGRRGARRQARRFRGDRRAHNVRLTPKGKRQFDAMAGEHERWIVELLGDVPASEREALYASLGHLNRHYRDMRSPATRLQSRATRIPPRGAAHGEPQAGSNERCRAARSRDSPVTARRISARKPARTARSRRSRSIARNGESADVRRLRGAARPLPRARARERRQGRRGHRQRRQLLLRRRRARDHRPADRDDDARAARVHADDGRPRARDARLPAADRRGRRRRLRGRGRDDRARVRHADRHAEREDRVPVRARRARRLRHGRVHAAAAHDRPGSRGGAALHRPRHDGRRGARLGILQSDRRAGRRARARRRRSRARWPTGRRSRTR